jgi:hypothetical protein
MKTMVLSSRLSWIAAFAAWILLTKATIAVATTNTVTDRTISLRGNRIVDQLPSPSTLLYHRHLTGETLTTTQCNVIRTEDYAAELQLFYSYLVEFDAGSSRSLAGVETAITHAVAQALDSCDVRDRPMFKVRTNARHIFSTNGMHTFLFVSMELYYSFLTFCALHFYIFF